MTTLLVKLILLILTASSVKAGRISNFFSLGNSTSVNAAHDNEIYSTNEVKSGEGYSYYKSLMMSALNKNSTSSTSSAPMPPDNHNEQQSTIQKMLTSTPIINNTINSIPTPKVFQTVNDAFAVLLEVAVAGIFEGLFPHVERQRREAVDEKKTIIDIVLNLIGALMGRQQCSQIVACRTGKFVGHKVPGAGVLMMMVDGIVPQSIRNWFNVVKDAVLGVTDDCETDFLCSLLDVDDYL